MCDKDDPKRREPFHSFYVGIRFQGLNMQCRCNRSKVFVSRGDKESRPVFALFIFILYGGMSLDLRATHVF